MARPIPLAAPVTIAVAPAIEREANSRSGSAEVVAASAADDAGAG
ncbi:MULTISPECIES: hypothetical protein [Brevibacterium]|nr:hypothetical protein [Brevibacterium sp. CS2]